MTTINTRTIKPSGGNYTSLSNWEAGRQGDLVASDYVEIAECYSMVDSTPVTIDGWNTGPSNYIKIYTPTSERHSGVWSASKYILQSGDNNFTLQNWAYYVTIDGLQIEFNATEFYSQYGIDVELTTDEAEVKVSNNIIKYTGSSGTLMVGITWGLPLSSSGIVKIWNNIVYDFPTTATVGGGLGGSAGGGQVLRVFCYNNTAYNCGYGFFTYGYQDILMKNNISYNNTTGGYYGGTNWDTTHATNNLSGPVATDAIGSSARNGVTVTFINADSDDFLLSSSDVGAKGYGANLTSDPNLSFSTDIQNSSRPSSGAWDIGASQAPTGTTYSWFFY